MWKKREGVETFSIWGKRVKKGENMGRTTVGTIPKEAWIRKGNLNIRN